MNVHCTILTLLRFYFERQYPESHVRCLQVNFPLEQDVLWFPLNALEYDLGREEKEFASRLPLVKPKTPQEKLKKVCKKNVLPSFLWREMEGKGFHFLHKSGFTCNISKLSLSFLSSDKYTNSKVHSLSKHPNSLKSRISNNQHSVDLFTF